MMRLELSKLSRRATLLALLLAVAATPALACGGSIFNNTAFTFTVTFSDHNFRGPLCWVSVTESCPPLSSSDRAYTIPPGAVVEYLEEITDGTWAHIERADRVARQDSFWQSRESEAGCRAWIANGDTSSWGLQFNAPADGDIAILAN